MKIIFANLIQPQKIILKIIRRIIFYYKLIKYNQNLFENKQNKIFTTLKLNRKKGIRNLNLYLRTRRSMSSEHEVLFSSISINSNISINDILEIGTYDGSNALLLSKLFPNSKIDTIDLPQDDDDFVNILNFKTPYEENKGSTFVYDLHKGNMPLNPRGKRVNIPMTFL